jgi:nucleoside-diphosphate-sugar epimerase
LDVDTGDITKEDCLNQYMKEDIRHIFHLAGKTFVPESWNNPYSFYQINVIGTLNVMEFCRKKQIHLTFLSSYPYGQPEYLPIDEKHPLQAYNPYSHSKLIAEEICNYYTSTFQLSNTVFRIFNVYGPGQSSSFLIPELISKIKDPKKDKIEVMDTKPRRDYIYIDDVIDALELSIDGKPGIYNVGSGKSASVREIIKILTEITGVYKPILNQASSRQNEILDLYSDIKLIKQELGWDPAVSLNDGLRRCVAAFDQENSSG